MPLLHQNVEEIEMLASRVKQEREGAVADLIARLHAINNELDAAWDGPSQRVFHANYGDWIQQLEKFSDTLINVNQYLTSVATNFRDFNEAADQASKGTATSQ